EDIRTKYGLTSLKAGGSCLALTAINEALEAAAQIADRSHAPEVANQIRALKWEAKMPSYASEIQTARDVAYTFCRLAWTSVHFFRIGRAAMAEQTFGWRMLYEA